MKACQIIFYVLLIEICNITWTLHIIIIILLF